jgi:hypothetical protein
MSLQGRARGAGPRPRVRLAAAVAALVAAAALVPLARVVPGGAGAFLPVDAYLPTHAGQQLRYLVTGSIRTAVTLRVTALGRTAGVPTLSLQRLGTPAPQAILPFGLSGGTVRVEDGSVVRTAEGGAVRDLVGPLAPGRRWSDLRHLAAAGGTGTTFSVTETRTLLGPAQLDEPAGHLARCVVVAVSSRATAAGGEVTTAGATLWYCAGVGLARAVLRGGSGPGDVIDLVGAG